MTDEYVFGYILYVLYWFCNSYTMDCPPERGDNPRGLASGLSYVQGTNMV